LFAAPAFDADDLEGVRFNQIISEIERSGFEVIKAHRLEDAEIAVKTNSASGCMVVDWGKKGLEGKTAALINLMRRRGLDFPIILLTASTTTTPDKALPFVIVSLHPGPIEPAGSLALVGRGSRH
jgi:DNA-binding response OmpR family regulator